MSRVRNYVANRQGRDFIVGDVYGYVDDFNFLLNHVEFNRQADRVFSTGNLVNFGPNSQQALGLMQASWFDSVLGSNEQIIERMVSSTPDPVITHELMIARGGQWLYDLATNKKVNIRELAMFLAIRFTNFMPYIIVVGSGKERFNIVHAELYGTRSRLISNDDIDKWTFNNEEIDRMVWGKTIVNYSEQSSDYFPLQHDLSPTYCGHSSVRVVQSTEHQIFIDTGVRFANDNADLGLTIVDPKTKQYWTYNRSTSRVSTYYLPMYNNK